MEASAAGDKLLCFPESFSYIGIEQGDSLKIAEPLDGPIMQGYCSLARESNIWLSLGGFQEKGSDDSHSRNTHVVVDDTGNIRSKYRKIHLFEVDVPGGIVYKESSFTEAGMDTVVMDSPFVRLGLTVCYGLRFPELYQHLRFQTKVKECLFTSALNFGPHKYVHRESRGFAGTISIHTDTAIPVIAAAQTGKYNEKRESYGDSLIIDPWGKIVARLPDRLSTGVGCDNTLLQPNIITW